MTAAKWFLIAYGPPDPPIGGIGQRKKICEGEIQQGS
jgi:hypothetical protein